MSTPDILSYYEGGAEQGRLEGAGALELQRTQDIARRWLPPPPAVVLDVGGGPGVYARWLASLGYETHLVDVQPSHVEQARAASAADPRPIASAAVGDARRLDQRDASVEAVLLLGPLYHLTERPDREQALRECRRVLRPGGVVIAAAISRFASLLDGLRSGFLDDPAFAGIVAEDLASGQHRNLTRHPFWFTTAYFHRPEELDTEMRNAGLHPLAVLAVEGPAWLLPDVGQRLADEERRARLMDALRQVEAEPSLMGVSAHLLAIGRKAS
ncbi:MAG: class I SAM-dependent methyltransferase [Candidatus Polarisedimenticolia bacterium]